MFKLLLALTLVFIPITLGLKIEMKFAEVYFQPEPAVIDKSVTCEALNAYHEARGEGLVGILLVTQVARNRSKKHNEDICTTIFKPFQFSWTASPSQVIEREFLEIFKIISEFNSGKVPAVLAQATHYHNITVTPEWANKLEYLGQYKNHLFYKE